MARLTLNVGPYFFSFYFFSLHRWCSSVSPTLSVQGQSLFRKSAGFSFIRLASQPANQPASRPDTQTLQPNPVSILIRRRFRSVPMQKKNKQKNKKKPTTSLIFFCFHRDSRLFLSIGKYLATGWRNNSWTESVYTSISLTDLLRALRSS